MLLHQLRSASFKGARWLCPEDEVRIGRNTIEHLFPDAPMRYAEDNGKIPGLFEVECILAEPGLPGKVAALKRAVSSPGPGVLRHPYWGNVFVMVDGPAKFSRKDREGGIVSVKIRFLETGRSGNAFPSVISGIAAVVSHLARSSISAVALAFAQASLPPLAARSLAFVASRVGGIGAIIDEAFLVDTQARRVASNAAQFVADRSRLMSRISASLIDPIDDTSVTSANLVRGLSQIVDEATVIWAEAATISPTTLDLAGRKAWQTAFAESVLAMSFSALSEAMAGRDYETADQVEADELKLGTVYEQIQASETLSAETLEDLREVYLAASEVLSNKAVRLPRLQTRTIKNTPASVLSYLLFESDEPLSQIVGLNPRQAPALMTGDVLLPLEG